MQAASTPGLFHELQYGDRQVAGRTYLAPPKNITPKWMCWPFVTTVLEPKNSNNDRNQPNTLNIAPTNRVLEPLSFSKSRGWCHGGQCAGRIGGAEGVDLGHGKELRQAHVDDHGLGGIHWGQHDVLQLEVLLSWTRWTQKLNNFGALEKPRAPWEP